jgi:tRNA threonylcarbamoyladenosine biosynthesis protein TsaB
MTRILAIETVGFTGSIALADNDRLVVQHVLPTEVRMAQSLAPGIRDLLTANHWAPADLELILVATGPGSFTGLRCGVTTAKTLAFATGAAVLGVHSLAVIAEQAPPECTRLNAVLDAQRKQLFSATFGRNEQGVMQLRQETAIVDIEAWLNSLDPNTTLAGPVLEKLRGKLPENQPLLPENLWQPRAAAVASLGWRHFASGDRDDLWQLTPNYYRPSAAEEKQASTLPG